MRRNQNTCQYFVAWFAMLLSYGPEGGHGFEPAVAARCQFLIVNRTTDCYIVAEIWNCAICVTLSLWPRN